MQRILTRLVTLTAALVLLSIGLTTPAGADNSARSNPGPAPIPSGETPPIDELGPPVSDPSSFGANCIRIDLLPGYGPNLTLEFSYDIVIMSDGTTNAIYYGAVAGDTIFTSSGSGLIYVIKCGFGGFGNYSRGDVTFLISPAAAPAATVVAAPTTLEFTLDGCQPGATALVTLDNGRSQSFVIPPAGFLTATIVADPEATVATAECNGFAVSGPADEDGAALIVAAGVDLPDATDPADPVTNNAPSIERTDEATDVAVASASAPSAAAIADAAATDGAAAITLAVAPERTFALGELDLVNPAAVEAFVEVAGDAEGDDYVVANRAIEPSAMSDTVGGASSSTSGVTMMRVGVGGAAALGLAAFVIRRRLNSMEIGFG